MNGQNNYDFVDKGIRDVSTLSADEAAEKLYWLDAVRRKIEMIRFDGSGRKVKILQIFSYCIENSSKLFNFLPLKRSSSQI